MKILAELERTTKCQPRWPDDPVHAAAHLEEECGELTRAALDYVYEEGELERLAEEAARCGALAIRFLENFGRYARGSGQ
jgi:NTP pyrophosphatase (non-canonical NTP hydrolase)